MTSRRLPARLVATLVLAFISLAPRALAIPAQAPQTLTPLVYRLRFPEPASKTFSVEIVVPTEGRASVDLMMAIWSPGFYGLQNYARQVSAFAATAADGTALEVTKPTDSRWTVTTGGRPSFTVSYTLAAPRGSNLSNGVTEASAVIIGPSTYVTLVEGTHRPAEVRLDLPATWTGSMTSLDASNDGRPNHYVAPDYDILADSPIIAGAELSVTPF